MNNKAAQWILWTIAMVIFLVLTMSGHTKLLGVAITAVALFWYGIVPTVGQEDNRKRTLSGTGKE